MTTVAPPRDYAPAQSSRVYEAAKRTLDVAVALAVLVGLAPFWAVVALAVRLTTPGPVIYRAEVAGRHGRPFTYYKFRSMYTDAGDAVQRRFRRDFIRSNKPYRVERTAAGQERAVYKVVDDPRVTPVGKLLRKFSIDEVPQFLNVLRGEMSVVGPRPPLLWEVPYYEPQHWERLAVKPGVTGPAQVRSRQGLPFDEMVSIDIEYVRRRSLWRDLAIMLATPFAMLHDAGRN